MTDWNVTFSYGRALQQSALKNWAKDIKDTSKTQKIFNHRSRMNGLSTSAKWTMDLEKQINDTGDWDDDIEKQFTELVESFKKTQTF